MYITCVSATHALHVCFYTFDFNFNVTIEVGIMYDQSV